MKEEEKKSPSPTTCYMNYLVEIKRKSEKIQIREFSCHLKSSLRPVSWKKNLAYAFHFA